MPEFPSSSTSSDMFAVGQCVSDIVESEIEDTLEEFAVALAEASHAGPLLSARVGALVSFAGRHVGLFGVSAVNGWATAWDLEHYDIKECAQHVHAALGRHAAGFIMLVDLEDGGYSSRSLTEVEVAAWNQACDGGAKIFFNRLCASLC